MAWVADIGVLAVSAWTACAPLRRPRQGATIPVDAGALASSLQRLLSTVDVPPTAPQQELGLRIGEVLSAASEVLGVRSVGLMLLDDADVLRVVGVSDQVVAALETAQQRLGVGPGIDSLRTSRTVAVDDLAESPPHRELWRWLRDGAQTSGAVARAVLSAVVRVRGEVVGTLNAMQTEPQRWSPDQARAVQAYADIIGVLLRLGRAGRPFAQPSDSGENGELE
jgi:GAF domain-containing protein